MTWLAITTVALTICLGSILILWRIVRRSIQMPRCPFCGASDDQVHLVKIDRPGLIVWVSVHCDNCNHNWSFPDPRGFPR